MVDLRKPCLVPLGLAKQEQASSECFPEWNRVALLGIFEWCVPLFFFFFLRKKILPSRCSPRASCYLEQGAEGSFLEVALIVRWSFVKKNSNMARSGFFLSQCLEVVCVEEVFWWRALFRRKSALTECSPRASCYLEQKVGGSWTFMLFENLCSEVVPETWIMSSSE